jgi:hypothetical protein
MKFFFQASELTLETIQCYNKQFLAGHNVVEHQLSLFQVICIIYSCYEKTVSLSMI